MTFKSLKIKFPIWKFATVCQDLKYLHLDATTGTVNWLVANIPSIDRKLDLSRRTRAIISYVQPDVSDKPEGIEMMEEISMSQFVFLGIHVLVLLLFEQKAAWQQRELSRTPADDFAVRDWITNNKHVLDETPLAGTFYGVRNDIRRNTGL